MLFHSARTLINGNGKWGGDKNTGIRDFCHSDIRTSSGALRGFAHGARHSSAPLDWTLCRAAANNALPSLKKQTRKKPSKDFCSPPINYRHLKTQTTSKTPIHAQKHRSEENRRKRPQRQHPRLILVIHGSVCWLFTLLVSSETWPRIVDDRRREYGLFVRFLLSFI